MGDRCFIVMIIVHFEEVVFLFKNHLNVCFRKFQKEHWIDPSYIIALEFLGDNLVMVIWSKWKVHSQFEEIWKKGFDKSNLCLCTRIFSWQFRNHELIKVQSSLTVLNYKFFLGHLLFFLSVNQAPANHGATVLIILEIFLLMNMFIQVINDKSIFQFIFKN